ITLATVIDKVKTCGERISLWKGRANAVDIPPIAKRRMKRCSLASGCAVAMLQAKGTRIMSDLLQSASKRTGRVDSAMAKWISSPLTARFLKCDPNSHVEMRNIGHSTHQVHMYTSFPYSIGPRI